MLVKESQDGVPNLEVVGVPQLTSTAPGWDEPHHTFGHTFVRPMESSIRLAKTLGFGSLVLKYFGVESPAALTHAVPSLKPRGPVCCPRQLRGPVRTGAEMSHPNTGSL